ncbi:MAG TPA: amino acid ABC transporter substrate-binding protein [Rubrivivax sp.]|nr:amino acid ABC transporter substrate-binding protein [Rubrivivax sp.]HPO19105.1 amino acid ABC transporter substrate-binding protein [Rubrivivax sp.]
MLKTVLATLCVAAAVATAPAAAQVASPTLAKIKAAKAINVAYSPDSAPFSSASGNAPPEGYSIELCKRVIAQVARTLDEPQLKVNWLPGAVAERLQMVATGRAELDCANTTQTQTRLASVDFSNLIFVNGAGLLVKAGAPINQIAELAGKRVAVLERTTTYTRLADAVRLRGIQTTLVPVAQAAAGLDLLEAGSVDAYAGDKVELAALALTSREPSKLALVIEELSYEPYALALPRNDSAFRLEANKALTRVYMSGEIEPIFMQWLGKLGQPSGLLALMFVLNSIPD